MKPMNKRETSRKLILTGCWRHNMYSHDSWAHETPSTDEDGERSLHVPKPMRQTKPGAVLTAQDMSGAHLQKQEMRLNVVHSNMNRETSILLSFLSPPRTRQDCTRVKGGGGINQTHNTVLMGGGWSTKSPRRQNFPWLGF